VLRSSGAGRLRSLLQPPRRLHGRLRRIISILARHRLQVVRRRPRRQSAADARPLYWAPVKATHVASGDLPQLPATRRLVGIFTSISGDGRCVLQ